MTNAVLDLDSFKSLIGRKIESMDMTTVSPLARMLAWLDCDDPAPKPGDPIIPGAHLLYFLSTTRQSALGPEGGSPRDDVEPRVPLQRKVWAGCRMRFHQPIRIGEEIRRVGEIKSLSAKTGRSGPLVFATIRDEIFGPGGLAMTEEMDIIFREDPKEAQALPLPQARPAQPVWRRSVKADPPFLFRFSALTYNSHRIHYDYVYTTQVEKYPGLLVTGPLQAVLLLDLARRNTSSRPIAEFSCRALRPIFEGAEISVEGVPAPDGSGAELWTADQAGTLGMTASVKFA
jgi:3-methylfumaryl-CoA hydratase